MGKKQEIEKTLEKSFEENMLELETIVSELESGKLPLGDMVALYERGTALGKKCAEMLDAFQGRIDVLEADE